MRLNKRFASFALCLTIALGNVTFAHADSSSVVTIGADLSESQKETVLNYFGVNKNDVVILEVNNLEERKYLQGVASEAQLGTKTYSCAYVQPTKKGNGINVKTANLTYVTSSMIASTLATCGVEDANVIAMTPLNGGVSGTGALTGVMKAFEDATGEKLDEEKKELASEELVTTGDLGDDIGQDKATGIMNDIKSQVIKNGTQDTTQIADTINNVTNNYNVTLTPEQEKQIQDLMTKIAAQDYNYDSLKNTFSNVSDIVDDNLAAIGEKVKHSQGFFEAIFNWFGDVFHKLFSSDSDLGILETTNDSALGSDAQIDATNADAITTDKNSTNSSNDSNSNETGFFSSIGNWFKNLFSSDDNKNNSNNSSNINININNSNSSDNNSTNSSNTNNSTNNSDTNNSASDSSTTNNSDTNSSNSNAASTENANTTNEGNNTNTTEKESK